MRRGKSKSNGTVTGTNKDAALKGTYCSIQAADGAHSFGRCIKWTAVPCLRQDSHTPDHARKVAAVGIFDWGGDS